MGGECNYLLRVNPHSKQLEFVPDDEWMTPEMLAWDEEDIKVKSWPFFLFIVSKELRSLHDVGTVNMQDV
jgi:hypothetical protein